MFSGKVVAAEALLSFSEIFPRFPLSSLFLVCLGVVRLHVSHLERPANALVARTATGARRPPWVE